MHSSFRQVAPFRGALALALSLVPLTSPAIAQVPTTRPWGGRLVCSAYGAASGAEFVWVGEDSGRIRIGKRTSVGAALGWSEASTPSNVRGSIRSIHFLPTADIGWAVSDDGWVLQSVDGGVTWSTLNSVPMPDPITPTQPAELLDVYFFDASNGFLCGANVLARSSDGGMNWTTELPANPPSRVYFALDFVGDANTFLGLVSTRPLDILYRTQSQAWQLSTTLTTAACGSTGNREAWDIQLAPGSTPSNAVAYTATSMASGCGAIHRGDYDATLSTPWSWVEETHECTGASSCGPTTASPTDVDQFGCPLSGGLGFDHFCALYSLYVQDKETALAVGYSSVHARVPNGNGVWLDITDRQHFSVAPLMSVVGTGAANDEAWMFGSFGDIRYVPTVLGVQSSSPSTPTSQRAYLPVTVQTGYRIGSIYFDANGGWAVGESGRIAHWDPTASAWRSARLNCGLGPVASPSLRGIAFGTSQRGVAVGVVQPTAPCSQFAVWPQIYMTRAGGLTQSAWAQIDPDCALPSSTVGNLNAIAVRQAPPTGGTEEYWAVGDNGFTVRIAKAGTVWKAEPVSLPNGATDELKGIAFLDRDHAIAVGVRAGPPAAGVVWELDPNASPLSGAWSPVVLTPSPAPLRGVACFGPEVWAVGDAEPNACTGTTSGTILRNPSYLAGPTSFAHECGVESGAPDVGLQSIAALQDPVSGAIEVLIGGDAGTLLRFDNTSWTSLDGHAVRPIGSVSVPRIGEGWALGKRVDIHLAESIPLKTDSILIHYP